MNPELNSEPLVSIIMPCYNVAPFIEKAIKSVFNQTYPNLELVCVNDGSTDNTADIIKKFTYQYNIKYIEQTNKGVVEARRTALLNANGEYIALVDADDSIEKSAIEKSLKSIINDGCDAVVWEFYSTTGGIHSAPLLTYDKEEIIHGIDALKQTIGGWKISGIGVFKKTIYEQGYAMYDKADFHSYNADEYITRAVFSKSVYIAKAKIKYFYYHNVNSATRKFKLDWLGVFDTDEAIIKLLKKTGIYNELKIPLTNQLASNLINLKNGYKSNYKGLRQDEREFYLKKCLFAIKKLTIFDYISWILISKRSIKAKIHLLLTIIFFKMAR